MSLDVGSCNYKKKIVQSDYSYCLKSYGADFKNIIIENKQDSNSQAQSITAQSIFLTLPQTSELNITVCAKVESNEFMLVQFINQNKVQPMNISYKLDSDSTTEQLYGLTSNLYKVDIIEALQLNFEVSNNNIDISFLCQTSKQQERSKLQINKLAISGDASIKSYKLQSQLAGDLYIIQYIYKGQFTITDSSYLLCESVSNNVEINTLIVQGKIAYPEGSENIQKYLMYGNNSGQSSVTVSNIVRGITTSVEYIYGDEKVDNSTTPDIPDEPTSITFNIELFGINADNNKYSYYVAYDSKQHSNKEILIKTTNPTITAENTEQKVSVFGNVNGQMTNMKITFDTGFNVTCSKIFGLVYSPTDTLTMNNVSVDIGQQTTDHTSTEVYGFIADINGKTVTLQDCEFKGQLKAYTVSMIGNISNGATVTLSNINVNATVEITKGAFMFFYSNDSNVKIENCNILGEKSDGETTIDGSKITGDMVSSVGFVFNKGQLNMSGVTINGWVDGQTYKSAGIINLYYSEGSTLNLDSVVFEPSNDHKNYYNCFTQGVMNIEISQGLTCPSLSTVSGTTILTGATTGLNVDGNTTIQNYYYVLDTAEQDYNNSKIEITIQPKTETKNYINTLISVFNQQSSVEDIKQWYNIQLTFNFKPAQRNAGHHIALSSFLHQQITNYTFINCDLIIQISEQFSSSSVKTESKTPKTFIGGYINQQNEDVISIFINCDSQITHTYTTTSYAPIQLANYIYLSQSQNQYINCNTSFTATNGEAKITSYSYQYQNADGCSKYQTFIDGTADEDDTAGCTVTEDLKWW